jgi:hypothetical protein
VISLDSMDSSDILRKKQAQTIYGFYKATLFSSTGLNSTTAATSPNLTFTNHGLQVGDAFVFGSIGTGAITWSTTPQLNTVYYVLVVTDANRFTFSATSGGSGITWSGTFTAFPTFYGPTSCITNSLACTSLTACVTTFPSYEERQQFITGSQACNSCSNTGCGCA